MERVNILGGVTVFILKKKHDFLIKEKDKQIEVLEDKMIELYFKYKEAIMKENTLREKLNRIEKYALTLEELAITSEEM